MRCASLVVQDHTLRIQTFCEPVILCVNPPLTALEAYLGIQTDHSVLTKKVGSSERGGKKVQVNALERWLLRRAVGPILGRLGYAC